MIETFEDFYKINRINLDVGRFRKYIPDIDEVWSDSTGLPVVLVGTIDTFRIYRGEFGFYIVEPSNVVVLEASELRYE